MFVVSLPPLAIGSCFMPHGVALPSTIPGLAPARNLVSLAQDPSNLTAPTELFAAAGLIDSRNAAQADQYGPVVDAFLLQHLARDPRTGKMKPQPLRTGLFTVTMPVPPARTLTGTLQVFHTAIINDARSRIEQGAALTPFMQLHVPIQWDGEEHCIHAVRAFLGDRNNWGERWLRSSGVQDLAFLASGARLLVTSAASAETLERLLDGNLRVSVDEAPRVAQLRTGTAVRSTAKPEADVME